MKEIDSVFGFMPKMCHYRAKIIGKSFLDNFFMRIMGFLNLKEETNET